MERSRAVMLDALEALRGNYGKVFGRSIETGLVLSVVDELLAVKLREFIAGRFSDYTLGELLMLRDAVTAPVEIQAEAPVVERVVEVSKKVGRVKSSAKS